MIKRITRIGRIDVFACALGLLLASQAFPQSDSARLQGVVTDSSGAIVPGASVNVHDVATNRVQKTTTGEANGAWSFPGLAPGNYELTVFKSGFKSVKQAVTLETAQVANVNIALVPGDVATQVVVTEEAGLIDSASSDMALTVQSTQIENLPLNGRNFTELATLIPGVSRGVPGNIATGSGNNAETFRYGSSGGAALVVNGARPQANNFTLDGVDNNESLVNTIVFFPPADAIQEFKVQTSVATAEFGRAGGAIVNTTLKSGSNQFHGEAFDFLRNSVFDAVPDYSPSKPPFRRNQFGGTGSAPIVKDKIFVFGDYQGFRQDTPNGVQYSTVPTALMRQGNFSELLPGTVINDVLGGTPFPGNIIPQTQQNPVGVRYLNAYPAANVPGQILNNYVLEPQQVQNFDDFDIRTDWNATENDRVFGRFSYAEDNEVSGTFLQGLPAGFGSGTQLNHDRGAAAGYTHVFGPTLLNDLRLNFQRTNFGYIPPFGNEPISANLGIPNANTSPLLGGGALIGGNGTELTYTGDYGTYAVPQDTYQLADTLSYVKGNHTLKFGANIIRREVNEFRPIAGKGFFNLFGNGQGAGGTGYEVSDILAGFVNDYQIGSQTGFFGTRSWEDAVFAQDDWRVSRRLTLNLGVRWDYLSKPTEEFGRQSNFDILTGALIPAAGGGDALANQNYRNFAPRVGFAYDVDAAGKTVVRGGYGLFYFPDRGGISNQLAQNEPFSGENQFNFSNGYRITLSGEGPMGVGNAGGLNYLQSTGALPLGTQNINLANPQNISVLADLPNNATSYMEQWNLQVQRELPGNILASVAYVGAGGHHLVDYYNMNSQLFDEAAGARLFPNLGSVNVEDARGNSIYNAMQAELQHRFSHGLQFTASYTHSRTIDDGGGAFGTSPQDFMNISLDRGLADQDIRGRFVLSGVYELPFGHGRRIGSNMGKAADALVGGWRLNAVLTVQSGLPFNLSDPGAPGGRPDVVGPLSINPGNTQQYFTTGAIALVPTIANNVEIGPGTLGRNVLIGPGIQTVDLGLSKTFSLTERAKMEFRAEAFNLANHPEFNDPGTDPTSLVAQGGNFGVINSTLANTERQVQFAVKIFF
jgi:hypothetical protein